MPKGVPNPKPVAPVDAAAMQASQKLLHDFAGAGKTDLPLPESKVKDPTKFQCPRDIQISTAMSGALLIRRGQIVDSPLLLKALRDAKVELIPVG